MKITNTPIGVLPPYQQMQFKHISQNLMLKRETTKIKLIIESNMRRYDFYFYNNIPTEIKEGAKSSYLNVDKGEEIICFCDYTFSKNGKRGVCLTTHAIYWKNELTSGQFVGYGAIYDTKTGFGLIINAVKYADNNNRDLDSKLIKVSSNYTTGKCTTSAAKELKKTLDEIVAYLNS